MVGRRSFPIGKAYFQGRAVSFTQQPPENPKIGEQGDQPMTFGQGDLWSTNACSK